METDLRASLAAGGAASAAAGGVAALLSALVGIFAGVPFGALLLRALVGGILIGALALAGSLFLRRLLPELFGLGPAEEAESSAAAFGYGGLGMAEAEGVEPLGHKVDIVLPGGDEEELSISSLVSPQAEGELEEELGYDGASLLDSEDAAAAPPSLARAALPQAGAPGFDDLDVLPDLESLSDSFLEIHPSGNGYSEAAPGEGSQARSPASPSKYPSAPGGGGSDPATLAQAVRTLLKRDQKG